MTLLEEIDKAATIVCRGGIILYPTDTVWGIGCDATNSDAVKRIFKLKQRADHKAMIVLVDSVAEVEKHVMEMPEVAYQLIDCAVKPLTIVYDGAVDLAPEIIGKDGSAGIRVTREAFSAGLCRRLRRPLVSTSANISGEKPATTFPEISREILEGVDYVVNYRRDDLTPALPSTVMKLSPSGEFKILRP